MNKSLQLTLCDVQGQLFELTGKRSVDSELFVRTFMTSPVAEDFDKKFHHLQWAGKEYIYTRMKEEHPSALSEGEVYDNETLYWMGYIYRYWHLLTGESSKEIYKQAPAKTMRAVYLMYHTMSPELAIDRLKDTYARKRK